MPQTKICHAVQPPQPCRLSGDWRGRFPLKDSEKFPYYENLLRSHQDEAKHYLAGLCEHFAMEIIGMTGNATNVSALISEYNGKGQPVPKHLLGAQINEFSQNFKGFERKISEAKARISNEACCPIEALALATFVHNATNKSSGLVQTVSMLPGEW